MPEGPEIRIAADEIAAAIAGHEVTKVFFAFDHLKPFERMLVGERVISVETRGKAMLIRFANGLNIFSHNQLYGQWMVGRANRLPHTKRQLRLAIHSENKAARLYSASDIEVLPDSELASHPFLRKLGPDLLTDSLTLAQVIDRFQHKRFQRRRLSSLLLDQQFLAGLGNYLRSEILFVGRTHPFLRPSDCIQEQIKGLAKAALELTWQSYRTKGITNSLELAERLRQEGYRRKEYRFWVFNRDDEPCYVCGMSIIKKMIGGRRLYFCPSCQS